MGSLATRMPLDTVAPARPEIKMQRSKCSSPSISLRKTGRFFLLFWMRTRWTFFDNRSKLLMLSRSLDHNWLAMGSIHRGDNIKGKWILSYNDCQKIRDLYREYTVISIDRTDNLAVKNGGERYGELIIKNY